MSTNVKLNEWEQEALSEKLITLNKKLVMKGKKPLKTESEIVHKVLEMTINKLTITEDGNIKIND